MVPWQRGLLTAGNLCRIVSYNPLHALGDRQSDILTSDLANKDCVALIGTGQIGDTPVECCSSDGFVVYKFGRTKRQNRSVGVSICLNEKKYSKANTLRVASPSKGQAKGRAGLVRNCNGDVDHSIFALYFPPRPRVRGSREFSVYTKIVSDILKWVDWQLCRLPKRTTPLVCTDLNDGLGFLEADKDLHLVQDRIVGPWYPDCEHYCSTAFRKLLQKHSLCVTNTFFPGRRPHIL